MSGVLFENVWLVGGIGILLTIMTTYGWLQTGSPIAMRVAIGLLLLTIVLILLNQLVVTEKESLRALIVSIAGELERNEIEKVRSHIHPSPSQAVVDADRQLPNVKFSVASVRSIHGVDIKQHGSTQQAKARMNVFVEVEKNGFRAKIPRWVQVTFEKSGGQWLVVDFEERDPQHEFLTEEGRRRVEGLIKN